MKIKELLETGTGGGGGAITTAANVATGPIYPNKKVKTSNAKGNNLLTGGSIVKRKG
jgi:hypothetical protein